MTECFFFSQKDEEKTKRPRQRGRSDQSLDYRLSLVAAFLTGRLEQEPGPALGFVDAKGRPQVTQNSMDTVADRDLFIEFAHACALFGA